MEELDRVEEYRRVIGHYRELSDDELLALARQPSELTEVAQQALANEVSLRKLKVEPESPASGGPRYQPPPDTPDPNDPYGEDRHLETLCTVWSLAEALQLQNLLDGAAIPFFIGPEKATTAEAVTSKFDDGLDVQVMSIGLPWAREVMKGYSPADDKIPVEAEGDFDESAVRCPKCHSSEVVLEDTERVAEGASPRFFKWTCDACGHHWEDDGVEAASNS